ncbi:MAG TPA: amidohydrolase family protein [Gemmatimonadales bacterium]|nr:amidohydrolase family protein [Gemmatimonadales bacterium]
MHRGTTLTRRGSRARPRRYIVGGLAVAAAGLGVLLAARPDTTETIDIVVHEGTTLAFDLSPDGKTIAFDLLGQLWTMPSAGGDARPITDAVRDTAEDLDPSWSPDGTRLIFSAERRGRTGLWLVEPGGTPQQLTQLSNPDGFEGRAAWAHDGTTIAFARYVPPDSAVPTWHDQLATLNPASRQVRQLQVPDSIGTELGDPSWAPDGRRVVFVAARANSNHPGRIWILDPASGRVSPAALALPALAPVFAPAGDRIAFLARDSLGRMQVWVSTLDADAAPVRLTSQRDVTPTRVRWTPDGTQLLYGADGRLWRISAAGGVPSEIPFTAELRLTRPRRSLPPVRFPAPGVRQRVRSFMGAALSPDARSIAMLALGQLWVMPVGGRPRAVTDVPLTARHLAWSPDGAVLAWSAGPWGNTDLFMTTLATGRTERMTALPGSEDFPAFAPSGHLLSFVHQPEERRAFLHIVDRDARNIRDSAAGRVVPLEAGADVAWSPAADQLVAIMGGFGPGNPSRAIMIPLAGKPHAVGRVPDSPLFPLWTPRGLVFVRHARLWRTPFDSTGMGPSASPLGNQPAIYPSASRDGTILFLSTGGLHLLFPDGRDVTVGWPLSYVPPAAKPMLVTNVHLIDGSGSPATPARDVLIESGRIRRIAKAGTLKATNAGVLDAEGSFAIPGLMELHAHTYRPEQLPGLAYFGVTTVRDQGSAIGPLVAWADAIAAGKVAGPRVDYGGIQFYTDWAYDLEDGQGIEPEADAGHAARAVALAGAFASQHIKTRTFRRWDINARLIANAHRLGMRATGHCVHPLPLIAAGMDAKEHAGFCTARSDGPIYQDVLQLFRAAGVAVIPTISYSAFAVQMNETPSWLDPDTELAPFVPERASFNWMFRLDSAGRREFEGFAEVARLQTAAFAKAGVTIGAGTDIWQIPTAVHMELEQLVEAGLTPLEAIHAATGAAAEIIGAEDELGTIREGKLADIVILDADPSINIRNTRRIRAVLLAGAVVDRTALVRQAGNGR